MLLLRSRHGANTQGAQSHAPLIGRASSKQRLPKNSDIKKNLKVLGSPPGPGISKLSNQLSGFCLKLFLIFFRQTKKTTDACRLKFSNPTTTDEKTVLNLMPHSKSSKSKQSTKNQPEEQKTKHYLMQELATR